MTATETGAVCVVLALCVASAALIGAITTERAEHQRACAARGGVAIDSQTCIKREVVIP